MPTPEAHIIILEKLARLAAITPKLAGEVSRLHTLVEKNVATSNPTDINAEIAVVAGFLNECPIDDMETQVETLEQMD
jgi:hypothetical protein